MARPVVQLVITISDTDLEHQYCWEQIESLINAKLGNAKLTLETYMREYKDWDEM